MMSYINKLKTACQAVLDMNDEHFNAMVNSCGIVRVHEVAMRKAFVYDLKNTQGGHLYTLRMFAIHLDRKGYYPDSDEEFWIESDERVP